VAPAREKRKWSRPVLGTSAATVLLVTVPLYCSISPTYCSISILGHTAEALYLAGLGPRTRPRGALEMPCCRYSSAARATASATSTSHPRRTAHTTCLVARTLGVTPLPSGATSGPAGTPPAPGGPAPSLGTIAGHARRAREATMRAYEAGSSPVAGVLAATRQDAGAGLVPP
jgi:hypothetical protein